MPKKRQPREVWQKTRLRILDRDSFQCVRCKEAVAVSTAHIDHIQSGKHGKNTDDNLRTLCRRCHVLRIDSRHRGMVAKALADGLIPANYRELMWE